MTVNAYPTRDGHIYLALDTPHLARVNNELSLPPDYGEHNDSVFTEVGITDTELADLRERGIVT